MFYSSTKVSAISGFLESLGLLEKVLKHIASHQDSLVSLTGPFKRVILSHALAPQHAPKRLEM